MNCFKGREGKGWFVRLVHKGVDWKLIPLHWNSVYKYLAEDPENLKRASEGLKIS